MIFALDLAPGTPHLENCSSRDQVLRKDVVKLESVPRRVTGMVTSFESMSSEDWLKGLGICSQEKRRLRGLWGGV